MARSGDGYTPLKLPISSGENLTRVFGAKAIGIGVEKRQVISGDG